MKSQGNGMSRVQRTNYSQGERPNWFLISVGALLSTLSIRLGFKWKQSLNSKRADNSPKFQKGNAKPFNTRNSGDCCCQSDGYFLKQDSHGCFSCISGNGRPVELKGQMLSESDGILPLVAVSNAEFSKDNDVIWSSSLDGLELPSRPFHHSNCSDSPCVSESGSDFYNKREVIHKLRQQLKRRDDMILEMQDQLAELQSSLDAQQQLSSHLQSKLEAVNRELFDSEREIRRLRKAIADHCVGHVSISLYGNGDTKEHPNWESPEKAMDVDNEKRAEMLKKQVEELKEVIQGKEYLVQSYKEQKKELSLKIMELQQRLDSQLPHIL
ncbi:uncharacterized protein LOC129315195 [Prosopis cineraria]|uniref:uncharacterized protein LOC129315195 n=1 Tax=Prosopis cineraria TaxID=364024 RepID=UPI00240EA8E7|nr:uncharacterized protein LOC129315195 [Prosopis cineraria]XP_054814740.1 uncharacterized protein LOC129315195 [Prosopis cineraria]XP_054814741.1 uncharacterized protein LOC129315195 [Prosopis cineraria]